MSSGLCRDRETAGLTKDGLNATNASGLNKSTQCAPLWYCSRCTLRTSSPARGLMDTVLTAAQRVPLLPIGTKGEQWAACRRWVPWLCAYTGARVGELTQLRAGDVQARQGPAGSIWVLRLTPDAGTIKTGRARTCRCMPAGIEASIRDAICGHAPRSTAESYEHVTPEDMAEALKRFPPTRSPHLRNREDACGTLLGCSGICPRR